MVFEQHLGHRAYSENVREAARESDDLRIEWWPIRYEDKRGAARVAGIVSESLAGTFAGRREVHAALRSPAHVRVFNTQVPAALGGRAARMDPYVVVTDITPVQQDDMGEGYGHRVARFGPLRRWKHRVNLEVFRKAEYCVGWSSWTAASIVTDYGVPAARVAVIPPGVDLSRWTTSAREERARPRVLFVGAEFGRKGGWELLDAFASLPATTELVLVTKTEVPSGDRITVIRDMAPNDPRLVELYRTSDVFALPSHAEAFGIAAVEAAASGLPVVTTDVGGLRDIVVNGETGLVVRPGDAGALSSGLGRLLADPGLRARLGRAARAHAERHFDAGTNARRLFDLVRAAAAGESGVRTE